VTEQDTPKITQTTLERIKLVVLQYITQELAEQFAIEPKAEIHTATDWMGQEIVLRVVQEVYGNELERIEAVYPADWWEAFKERWLPAWAKKRWPVKHKKVQLVAQELYPKLSAPQYNPVLHLHKYTPGEWD